jgi:branched-chain amino acid transport system permease protein
MTTIWIGLTIGAEYALVALVYNMVWIGASVFNFAQAQVVMAAIFASYVGSDVWHLDTFLTLALVIVVAVAACLLIERLAIRPLSREGQTTNELITTVGAAVVLDGLAINIFGTNARTPTTLPSGADLDLAGGRLQVSSLVIIATAVACTALVAVLVNKAGIGIAWRAAGEDSKGAEMRGVDVRKLAFVAFLVAGLLSAVVGVVIGGQTLATYNLGDLLAVKAFVALALGGIGSTYGPLIGGLSIGLIEAFSERYAQAAYADLAEFGVLVLLLLLRPQGLLGIRRLRQV